MDDLLQNYQPNDSVKRLVASTPIVLLVGITGAGKDTVKKSLLATGEYIDFVSYTTRQPRQNHGVLEQDGIDYHFVTHERMMQLLERGEMIEAKQYSSNVYGTGIADLQKAKDSGKIAVNDIEVQGINEYKKLSESVHAVFLLPPSYDVWQRRLMNRYGDSDHSADNMDLRLKTAAQELQHALGADYFDFVINETVEDTVEKIARIVSGDRSEANQRAAQETARGLLNEISERA